MDHPVFCHPRYCHYCFLFPVDSVFFIVAVFLALTAGELINLPAITKSGDPFIRAARIHLKKTASAKTPHEIHHGTLDKSSLFKVVLLTCSAIH
jgi:hypothetical protein